MLQAPVNYYQPPVQAQPSYNAVKIDIHNPKVMDACKPCQPTYPTPYNLPVNPYYAYPQATGVPCYPQMPQINPCMPLPTSQVVQQPVVQTASTATATAAAASTATATVPTPVPQVAVQPVPVVQPTPVAQSTPVVQQPVPTVPVAPVTPQVVANCPCCNQPVGNATVTQPSVAPTPVATTVPVVPVVPVVPAPVPQAPVQQVINNGVPAQQTIQQSEQPVQEPAVNTANANASAVATATNAAAAATATTTPQQVAPNNNTMPSNDISVVLKGLQSNNMAEQSEALSMIGQVAENPQEVKKYLETSILDSVLNILNADTSKLEPATQEQIDARTKLMNGQPLTDAEKNLAMTLAPQEFADRNKQHALYSLAILQKSLANEIEAKTGEKLTMDKLPAIDQVINTVKANPNPLLRASALVALAHLDKPEYKPVLSEIFQIAQNDKDPNVQQVAQEALNKLNGVAEQQQAATATASATA